MSDSEGFLSGEGSGDEEEPEVIDVEAEEVESESVEADSLIKPATDDLEEVHEVYEQFEQVKSKLLGKQDLQKVSGSMFITKSGWRKIATAFSISTETIDEGRTLDNGVISWRVKARATAPNGQSATGVGMASSNESNFMDVVADGEEEKPEGDNILKVDGHWRRLKDPRAVKEHDLFATAATRAKNRAISDLVGGGEVSAEEMDADKFF